MPPLPFPRPLAVEILNRVDGEGGFAEPLLDHTLSRGIVTDERDRRLLTELVYGTLRMQGYLDWLIEQFYQGGIRTLEPVVRNTLRTALYQRFFTERIPEFAIVNEAVELIKKTAPRRAPLVNAILRNILRRHESLPRPGGAENDPETIAVLHSHPVWLVRRWLRQWSPEETIALCRANNRIPPLCVRVNRLRGGQEEVGRALSAGGVTAERTVYSPDGLTVVRAARSLRETDAYTQGLFQVQDEASQMIARLVAPAAGDRVLDLCAGIGGKASHLAAIMGNRGEIVAVDIHADKLALLSGLAARLGVTIMTPHEADGTEDLGAAFARSFDRVLLDAPCTGVGTLRRAPEIKWRLTPRDLRGLTDLQKRILERAAAYVRPGGRLIYSTCSILAEENESIVGPFLASHRDFSLLRPSGVDETLLDGPGYFRTYPHRHGMDGFFGALMVKR